MSICTLDQYDETHFAAVHNSQAQEIDRPAFSWQYFATTVVEKTADLLQALILLIDHHNCVFAASDPQWIGLDLATLETVLPPIHIKALLSLDCEAGELRVYPNDASEAVSPLLVNKIVHLIVDQVLMAGQLPRYNVLKDRFIYNVLNGLVTDPAVIELNASNLGLDLSLPRAVLLIDAQQYLTSSQHLALSEAQIDYRINTLVDSIVNFFSLPNAAICAYMGRGEIAILKATDTHSLADWAEGTVPIGSASWANLGALKRATRALLAAQRKQLNTDFTIGIGRHHPGITGLSYSYQDARAALSLGRRFYNSKRVHCLDELGTASFIGIADERIKSDLATRILSPLHHEPALLETLVTFINANCGAGATAEELDIHRNTLNYRLDKIVSLLGLDPRRFDDAVQLQLALLLRSQAAE